MCITVLRLWYLIQFLLVVVTNINCQTIRIANVSASITSDSITSNSITSITSTSTTTTTTTTTIEPCAGNTSNGIEWSDAKSNMFVANITYNCSLENSSELFVFNNGTEATNCNATEHFSNESRNSTVIVNCRGIEHYAGRDWSFDLSRRFSFDNTTVNETFNLTLAPLPLSSSTNISVKSDGNLTSRTVVVRNCTEIADLKYLVFRCNISDSSNKSFSENCTQTCDNLKPGFNNTALLIRLPIPMTGQNMNSSFPEENQTEDYQIGLDKVTNLSFNGALTENESALIHFTPPRGDYEKICVFCSVQDHQCWKHHQNSSNSVSYCYNCTSILLPSIIQGVNYICEAFTIKNGFDNAPSDPYSLNTSLQSVSYDKRNSSNISHIIFNVTPQSDFDRINSTCIASANQTYPCSDLTVETGNCSKTLKLNGNLGCNYQCFFVTRKENYAIANSSIFNLSIDPPTPTIIQNGIGSRWISVNWTINEIAYIQSFDIFNNETVVTTLNNTDFLPNQTTFSHSYTELVPYKNYTLSVQLNSNSNVKATPITVLTLEEAPKKPDDTDVENKIILHDDNGALSSTQYAIELNPSLFSDDYGKVCKYLIYVRQDQNNNMSDPDLNGTYAEAYQNASIDYLAAVETLDITSRNSVMNSEINISVILGNETLCMNDSLPCNGPLKPGTWYKVIVGGCTLAGCTHVLPKKAFQTRSLPPIIKPPSSKAWVVVFPLMALFVVAAVISVRKRKQIKQIYNNKVKRHSRSSQRSLSPSISLTPIYTVSRMRPKPLSNYIGMTNNDEKAIHAEFQELDAVAPRHRQSEYESEYAVYNRYANIPARGHWDRTAVRLTAPHRNHDYINANEVQGFYSKKQYIACQGPMEDTCQDFWDMIFQYHTKKIVMLTRTEERNPHNPSQLLPKCHHYFPEGKGQSLTFGEIVVQVVDVEHRQNGDLEIRHILIKDGTNEHRVVHYYFTGWPDFSVVDQRKLLDLIETVNQRDQNSQTRAKEDLLTPIVVHCSAGVGRTGTYIAVDIIMHLLNRTENNLATMELDVMGIVHQLRQDRGKMVQTKDQYMLVNRCVEEYLRRTNRLDAIPKHLPVYENTDPCEITTSADFYMNSKKPNNGVTLRSSIKPPPVYANIEKDNLSSSNTHPPRSTPRRSKYEKSNDSVLSQQSLPIQSATKSQQHNS